MVWAQEPGLAGHWIFDATHIIGQTVKDLAGNHDAVIEGTVELAAETGGRGLKLNSIKLNGKTDAVLLADVISPEELPQRDITVEVWVCLYGGSVWNSIIGYFEDAGNVDRGWGWWLGFNGNNFCFTLSSTGSRSGDGIATYLYAPSFFDNEKWYHVAGTYDGAWQRIYVNGKLENSSDTQSGDIHYRKDASYIIGAYRDADENRAMEGWIYEARVYDRALSPDELRSHYEALADMPAIPLPTPAEAKETSPALDTAPGIWRFWKAQDGLGDTWCYGASIGPTGNLSVTHVERSMHDDYLDGYTVHPLPACLPYSRIVEGPEKLLWLFNWKDTGAIRTYEVTGNASPGNWRRHLLPSPILFSAFGLTFHPLDNHRFLYISQDQRILETDIQSGSSKVVIQGSNTRLGEFLKMIPGRDNHSVWISSQNGLGHLQQDGTWREHLLPGREGPCLVEYETDAGEVVGFTFKGLVEGSFFYGERTPFLFDGAKFLFHVMPNPASAPRIDLLQENTPLIRQDGLLYSVAENLFIATTVPREDNALWLPLDKGLTRYAPAIWQTPQELRHKKTKAYGICEDESGRICLCYDDGLALFQDSAWSFIPYAPSLDTRNSFVGILPGGRFYWNDYSGIMTYDITLQQFHLLFTQNDTKRYTACLGQGRPDKFWISEGTTIGLYDGRDFEPVIDLLELPVTPVHPANPLEIKPYFINDIEMLRDDEVWIATNGGLFRIVSGRIAPFAPGTEFPAPFALEILKTRDGTVWISTNDILYRFDGHQWLKVRDGLDSVKRMRQTRDGSLWIAATIGLFCYRDGSWMKYTTEDGLPHNYVNDVLEDRQGRVWATTDGGLSLYHPDRDRDPPETYVIDQGRPVQENTQSEDVSPEGNLRIVFTGMDKWKYTETDRLLYSHRIDTQDWTPFTSESFASLTGLPYGEHVFQVRAMDHSWNVDPTPAAWKIRIVPPWYKDNRFILLFLTCLGIIGWLTFLHARRYILQESVIQARTRDLHSVNQELLRYQEQLRSIASRMAIDEERSKRNIARQIHDRIGHSLALCQMQIEYLQRGDNPPNTRILEEVRQTVKQIIEDSRELTIEISPPILYELGLMRTLQWLIEQLNEKYGMNFVLVEDGFPSEFGMDERGIVFNAIKELLYNVIKHAHTRSARVSLSRYDGLVQVQVSDDGVGFSPEDLQKTILKKQSFGLFSVRERIEYLGGTFHCVSRINGGTQVTLTLPWPGEGGPNGDQDSTRGRSQDFARKPAANLE